MTTNTHTDLRDTVAHIIDPEAFSHHGLTYQPNRGWEQRRERANALAEEIIILLVPWEVPDAD